MFGVVDGRGLDDWQGMLGRVLFHALSAVPRRLSNKALASMAAVSESALSRLLSGRPMGATPWSGRAQRLLHVYFLGRDPKRAPPEAFVIADRIIAYFFREPLAHDHTPKFFRGRRVYSPDPWSATELAAEVDWLARQALLVARDGQPTRLVMSSGFERLLAGDPYRTAVAESLVEAIRAGVEVVCLVPVETPAHDSCIAFERLAKSELSRGRFGIYLIDRASPLSCRDYASRTTQFMFFEWARDSLQTGLDLFIVRGRFYESDETDDQPLAITCNDEEAKEFKAWYDSLGEAGVAPRWIMWDRSSDVETEADSAPGR